jgi:hypothetical protein
MKRGKNPIIHIYEFPRRRRIHMHITAEYKQPLPHASAVYNLVTVYVPLHAARYLCKFMVLEKNGTNNPIKNDNTLHTKCKVM